MKNFLKIVVVVAAALASTSVYAQCLGGRCFTARTSYRVTATYAGRVNMNCPPCGQVVETVEPCEPVQESVVEPCEPVRACDPVQTVEPCAPVECDGAAETVAIEVKSCPIGGACPIRTVARAAGNVVKSTVSFLDIANRTRARYGLPVLQYDETLTVGAQYQAQYCSRIGGLQHGAGAVEILAYNNQGIEAALNQWLASPAHRALLLNRGYRYAGVAVVRDSQGRAWCAMRFK